MAEPWTDADVLTAAHLAGMPWGVMGYVNGSGTQAVTAEADLTGLSVTFTAVSSRLYRTTLSLYGSQATLGSVFLIIADGASALVERTAHTIVDTYSAGLTVVSLQTGLSGSTTRKGRCSASAGTFTAQLAYGSIIVEDVGAA